MDSTPNYNEGLNPQSKFVIDLSVNGSTHSLDGPSVTRNAVNELKIVGSMIIDPNSEGVHPVENPIKLITSADNARRVADVSRSAREHFMQTISRLKRESRSSLAYLEQLQSNTECNISPRLQHLMSTESEGMTSEDMDSVGFQSSYFFPNSLKPITSHSNPDLPSEQELQPHPTYQLRLDSESDCNSEQTESYTPVPHRDLIAKRDRYYMEDFKFGGSQAELNSLTPLGVPLRRMSCSFPNLSSPAQMEEHSEMRRSIEHSQSDPHLINCLDGDCISTLRRVQSSPKIEMRLDPCITDFNHGCKSITTKVQKESESVEESFFTAQIEEPSVETRINASEVLEFDDSTNQSFPIQETKLQEQDLLVENLEVEIVNNAELTPEVIIPEENEDQLKDRQLAIGDVPERVRIAAEPPLLTEREPDTARTFHQQGTHIVKNMWNDFSFSKYIIPTPKARRPLRTTIPQPFSFYYKSLEPRKKTRAQVEGEVQRRLELDAEEEECSRKFTAQPVPNTTYEYILSRDEKRREQNRMNSNESLKSSVRPFKFDEREAAKRAENKARYLSQQQSQDKYKFKAKPVPNHLFQSRYDDEVAEQDLYREIRKVMRTNKLLSNSKLPSSMTDSDRAFSYTDGRKRLERKELNSRQAFLTSEHRFRPTVNKRMPDFKRQQELFEQKMSERKEAQRVTRIEFSEQDLDLDDLNGSMIGVLFPGDKEVLKISSRISQVKKRPNTTPRADEIYGHAPTKSTQLRQISVHKRLTEQEEKERDESERAQQQMERVLKMKRQVSERVKRYDNSEEMARRAEEKKRHFRETESSRKAQYTEHLRRIKKKLDERPLVFERAPLEANKKLTARRLNSPVTSPVVSDDPGGLFDETFTKSYLVHPNVLSTN